MNTGQLRMQYRPSKVQVLFVGESPPAGGTFFYAGNSNLFRYTQMAFEHALGRSWVNPSDFLTFFRSKGFYLEDLCLTPVNGLTRPERIRCCKSGIDPLAKKIKKHVPRLVFVTPKAIASHVTKALQSSGHDAPIHSLPFPAMSWQRAYVDTLAMLLKEYVC